MSDSSSFTSLYDLVDSHLSKCSIYETNSNNPFNTPSNTSKPLLNGVQQGLSDTRLIYPERGLATPKLSISDSPIQKVLAEQINNMLKRKAEEEKQIVENIDKLQLKDHDDEYMIDLMQAIQVPTERPKPAEEILSRSSSFESLMQENIKYFHEQCMSQESKKSTVHEPYLESLPCETDISYILTHNVNKAKCSDFGKVLRSRLREVPAPYLEVTVDDSQIKRFDFSTKSPCDVTLEKLRQPSCHTSKSNYIDIMEIIMAE